MLLFCPICANTLTVSRTSSTTSRYSPNTDTATLIEDDVEHPEGQNRLECRTCPYQFLIDQSYYERKEMKRKEVEDVLGGKEGWENVDRADAQCPRDDCSGSKAYFYQVQIRSADEPMTTFYKCVDCSQRWKEN